MSTDPYRRIDGDGRELLLEEGIVERLAPRRVPEQLRAEVTVQAIVDAAGAVLERHGYALGTTGRIAERAGVSIGSVYVYFPNKDAVLVALAHQHLGENVAALRPQFEALDDGADFEEILPEIVWAMVAMHASAPALHRVLFEETPLPSIVHEELNGLEDQLVDVTAMALSRDDDLSDVDAQLRARIVINTIESLTHRFVLHPPAGVGREVLVREITEVVRGYIGASERGPAERYAGAAGGSMRGQGAAASRPSPPAVDQSSSAMCGVTGAIS